MNGSVGGVDTKKFKYNEKNRIIRKKLNISKKDFIFFYLGRINKDKGIIDLISAFNKIKKYKTFLLIVGPIEDNHIKNIILKK